MVGTGATRDDVVIRYDGNTSSDCMRATSVQDILIENMTIDNGEDNGFVNRNCIEINASTNVRLRNVKTINAADAAVNIVSSSSYVYIEDSDISDTPNQEGVTISASHHVYIRHNTISRNQGFGVFATETAHHLYIENNDMEDNLLEGVGIRYTCHSGSVSHNHVKGSGDNGISITGQYFQVNDNKLEENEFHGLSLYGDRNVALGNQCWNNGQAGAGNGYAGIAVVPGSGGAGSYNIVGPNQTGDAQAVKTQDYGVKLTNTTYTSWANGQSIILSLATAVYRVHLLNLYEALSSGTTATGSEPVHTSGTVAGADTIQWKFIAAAPSGINFAAAYNRINENQYVGNGVSPYNISSNCRYNTYQNKEATSEFNVKAFGAVGDGVTADTNAINAASTAAALVGGVVKFPFTEDSYNFTFTLPDAGVRWEFDGDGDLIDRSQLGGSAGMRAHKAMLVHFGGPHTSFSQVANHIRVMADGSTQNGPASADFCQTLHVQKKDYLTTSIAGEIDGQYIFVRQGGPNVGEKSAGMALVMDVEGVDGCGFIGTYETVVSLVNSSGVVQKKLDIQEGVLNGRDGDYYGTIYTCMNGTLNSCIYAKDDSGATWTDFLRAQNSSGIITFKVGMDGKVTTKTDNTGNTEINFLNTSGVLDFKNAGGLIYSL